MSVLLLQEKYHRVHHVNQLGDVEHPGHVQCSQGIRRIGIFHWLTLPTVVTTHVKTTKSDISGNPIKYYMLSPPSLVKSPNTEASLKQIVRNHKIFEIVWFAVTHEPGPRNLDDVDVAQADDDGGPDGGHQRQAVSSGVPHILHQPVIMVINPYKHTSSFLSLIPI